MQDSSTRCFTTRAPQSEPPLFLNGHLVLQLHDIGWIVSGLFTIIATSISTWLISRHLVWYTNMNQQRYIVRLLLMVPIYAIISLASYVFWNHSVPLTLIRDSYESFVIYSFFYLLLEYLSPTVEGQKDVVRNAEFKKWLFPLGTVKYRPIDGLYFLQLMKWGILQYCIIRPGTTIVAVILDFVGLYCEDSWSFRWGHVYITVLVSLSVTVAMFCLLQFYSTLSTELAPHHPLLKFISIKSVVFLTFWQASLLSILATFGLIKDKPTMTSDAIQNGIATILETVEMAIFAVVHLRAFTYVVYIPKGAIADQKTSPWRSLKHVLDIREFWYELVNGSCYMNKSIRGIEADGLARRRLHFAKVMGKERRVPLLERNVDKESDDDDNDDNGRGALTYKRYSSTFEETYCNSDDLTGRTTVGNLTPKKSILGLNKHMFSGHHSPLGHDEQPLSHNTGIRMPSNSVMAQPQSPQPQSPRNEMMDIESLIQPISLRFTGNQNTKTDTMASPKTIHPTELYDVPLANDILPSIQKPTASSMSPVNVLRGGTTHFLVDYGRNSTSVKAGGAEIESARGFRQSRNPPRHRPSRIVLPTPLG